MLGGTPSEKFQSTYEKRLDDYVRRVCKRASAQSGLTLIETTVLGQSGTHPRCPKWVKVKNNEAEWIPLPIQR
jgi:hypothetical protein